MAYHFVAELLLLLDVYTSITALTVDIGSSSRAGICLIDLLER